MIEIKSASDKHYNKVKIGLKNTCDKHYNKVKLE